MLFVWALILKAHLKIHGCAQVEVPQDSVENSIQRTNNQCSPKSANGECSAEAAFSRKVSVSVADAGETALVVSIIGGNQWTEEPNEKFFSKIEADKGLTNEAFNLDKVTSASSERSNMQTPLEARNLDLSLLHDMSSPSISLGPSELKKNCVDEKLNGQSSFDGIKISSRKIGNKLSESESSMGLHLGLSVGSFLSVDGTNKDVREDQAVRDAQQNNPSGESFPKACKIEPDTIEDASQIIGVKRNLKDDDVHVSADAEETKGKKKNEVPAKKIRAEGKTQMTSLKDNVNVSTPNDSRKSPTLIADANDDMSKLSPKKEDVTYDVMSIVKGTGHKPSKGQNSDDNFSKERENAPGLRIKKIMKRTAQDDKDSSVVVQELRKEIREAVRNRFSTDVFR
ncbi:hypothetical protein Q3G72_026338 [Acer saccharum]|nr:hypothetical protein Q3G72_026338 [Acer saccharum]